MYSKKETPLIRASILYYDRDYDADLSKAVLEILEKHGYFPPEKICADKLTKEQAIPPDSRTREIFIKAYAEKDVLGITMSSGDIKSNADYWMMLWAFTFYKNSKLAVEAPKFNPWNVLTLYSTYDRLDNASKQADYVCCVKELIQAINPFYANIDDTANSVSLLRKTTEKTFIPDRVQQIYWGNYFGEKFCEQYGHDSILNLPAKNIEPIGSGCMFFLSDDILDFSSRECKKRRRLITARLFLAGGKEPI